jgi:hypothetical protein
VAAADFARPIPRVFLERVSRALLVRVLSAHDALAAHAFPLDALASSAQTDRALVDVLWTLLSAPPPDLAALHADLTAIADLATHAGHEQLLAHDAARALDPDLGAEVAPRRQTKPRKTKAEKDAARAEKRRAAKIAKAVKVLERNGVPMPASQSPAPAPQALQASAKPTVVAPAAAPSSLVN